MLNVAGTKASLPVLYAQAARHGMPLARGKRNSLVVVMEGQHAHQRNRNNRKPGRDICHDPVRLV